MTSGQIVGKMDTQKQLNVPLQLRRFVLQQSRPREECTVCRHGLIWKDAPIVDQFPATDRALPYHRVEYRFDRACLRSRTLG